MSNSFDLITQYTYDLFSHSKYIQLCNLHLEYLCDEGHIKLSAEQFGDEPSFIQVLLNTEPGMLYVYELQGKIVGIAPVGVGEAPVGVGEAPVGVGEAPVGVGEAPVGVGDQSATIYVEDVETSSSLLTCTYKFNDNRIDDMNHHRENDGNSIKICRKSICDGFEDFNIYFRAKSDITAIGIFFDCPYTDLIIRQFNITKLDSHIGNASCISGIDTDSDSSECKDYPLESCPCCPTHGNECPTQDPVRYGNPEICPTHGLKCPTFEDNHNIGSHYEPFTGE